MNDQFYITRFNDTFEIYFKDIGNQIITEPGVVSEIKSKRQLRRLVVLPYDLEVKEAYPEDIKFGTFLKTIIIV